MPLVLNVDEIGLLNLIIAYSLVFTQLSSLGFTYVTTRMFTYFRDYPKKHHGFFFILTVAGIVGFVLIAIIFHYIKPIIIKDNIEQSKLFVDYLYYILPLVFFQLFFLLLDNYYKVLYNTVFGTLLKEFVLRFLATISILLFLFKQVSFDQFVFIYFISYAVPTLFIFIKLLIEKQISLKFDFSLLDKKMVKTILSVAFFGITLSFAGVIVSYIDKIMINSFEGLGSTGIYSIAFYFGSIIMIPNRSLQKISSVVIADAWKKNDLSEIKTIYSKSCLNQFILAVLLFIGIWGNIHNIFRILPSEFESGKYVIFFIALNGVIFMLAGVSTSIISNSKYYKAQSGFMLIYFTLLIVSNYLLIPKYGITGAALATLISTFIFVSMRFLFLLIKYKFQPYNFRYIIISLAGLLAFFIPNMIPTFENYLVDIFVRSLAITVIFVLIILISKVSIEANMLFKKLSKFKF